MSVDVGRDYRIQISKKMQKRKVLEELVFLQILYNIVTIYWLYKQYMAFRVD